jgi:hypothetical protein
MDEKNEKEAQYQILAYRRKNVTKPILDIFRTSHMTESVSIDDMGVIGRIHGKIGDREKILLPDDFVNLIFDIKAEEDGLERDKAEASEHPIYRQILEAPDRLVHVSDLPRTKSDMHIIYYARQTDNKLRFFIHGPNMLVTSQLAIVVYEEEGIIKQHQKSGYMFIPDDWVNQLTRIYERQQSIDILKNQFKQHHEYKSVLIPIAGQIGPVIKPIQNPNRYGFSFLKPFANTGIQNSIPASDEEESDHEKSLVKTYKKPPVFPLVKRFLATTGSNPGSDYEHPHELKIQDQFSDATPGSESNYKRPSHVGRRLTRQKSLSDIEQQLSGGSPKSNKQTLFDSDSRKKVAISTVNVQKDTPDETKTPEFKV